MMSSTNITQRDSLEANEWLYFFSFILLVVVAKVQFIYESV